jgi:hypothetical protein
MNECKYPNLQSMPEKKLSLCSLPPKFYSTKQSRFFLAAYLNHLGENCGSLRKYIPKQRHLNRVFSFQRVERKAAVAGKE